MNLHTLVIAEIGTSHNGSLEKAFALIDAAHSSGADYAKFQWVYADEILHPETGTVILPTGNIRLYDRFKSLELDSDFYRNVKNYCDSKGIGFLCSPFGLKSARELINLKPDFIKIASPELNHTPLLKMCAEANIPLILSSGVSKLKDIERALELTSKVKDRILLHCITSYPAPEDQYNIKVLESLSTIFGIRVGVSDHSLDPILVPVLSLLWGSCVEKHITLSKKDEGLDDPVALEPKDFKSMVKAIRKAEGQTNEEIIAEMSEKYGKEKLMLILGDGVKKLALSEKANYLRTNRSIHYLRNLKAGERLGAQDIAILRTEKKLSIGLHPDFYEQVLGSCLVRDVQNGDGLSLDDFIKR